jgi:hypothetical protein
MPRLWLHSTPLLLSTPTPKLAELKKKNKKTKQKKKKNMVCSYHRDGKREFEES